MSPEQYSPEQRKDIEERVEKAKTALAELNLQPATLMSYENLGNDVFGLKPLSFLQDTKYQNVISPIQNP